MEIIEIYERYNRIMTDVIRFREELAECDRNMFVEEIDGFMKHIEKASENLMEIDNFEEIVSVFWDGDQVVWQYSGECPHCRGINRWDSRDFDREEIPCRHCREEFKPAPMNLTTAKERAELLRQPPNCVQP